MIDIKNALGLKKSVETVCSRTKCNNLPNLGGVNWNTKLDALREVFVAERMTGGRRLKYKWKYGSTVSANI